MRSQTIRTVAARVSSAGVPNSSDVSAVRLGSGQYNVTLRSDWRALGVHVTADNSGGGIVAHATLAGNLASVFTRVMNTATATDCATFITFQAAT